MKTALYILTIFLTTQVLAQKNKKNKNTGTEEMIIIFK
jgi:hypothetical protein